MDVKLLLTLAVWSLSAVGCFGASKYCYKPVVYYYTYRWCLVNAWGWCIGKKTKVAAAYRSHRYCCPGYKGNNCDIPICVPPCENGGVCISPNNCKCPVEAQGQTCQTKICSHTMPCFPGTCDSSNNCMCHDGFGGNSCLDMPHTTAPEIYKYSTVIKNIRRDTGEELYGYTTDSSIVDDEPLDKLWSKEKDYNYFKVSLEGLSQKANISDLPYYIENFSFGIVQATVKVVLIKMPRQGSTIPTVALNETYNCSDSKYSASRISNDSPNTGVLNCSIVNSEFSSLIEHGDNFTFTTVVGGGGYRDLIDKNTNTLHSRDYYKSQSVTESLLFQFDFRKPYHCIKNGTCNVRPLTIYNDVTKSEVVFSWNGWHDDMSGVFRYTWEIHKLEPEKFSRHLTEVDPMRPVIHVNLTTSEYIPPMNVSYAPEEPGVYSVVLEVADKANNSIFARQIFLYDNMSNISIDNNAEFYVSSANNESKYQWQNTIQTDNSSGEVISITWKGRFANRLHDANEFLNLVAAFPEETLETGYGSKPTRVVKTVNDEFDDHDGKRTLRKVANAHGIVEFRVAYMVDQEGGNTIEEIPQDEKFIAIADPTLEGHTFNTTREDGDTMRIWVRGIDILGNHRDDDLTLNFDSSPPFALNATIERNIDNGSYPFSSRILLDAYDEHSGILKVGWRILDNNNTELQKGEDLIPSYSNCGNLTSEECECIPLGSCFLMTNLFNFDNCRFAVPKDNITFQELSLELFVYNMAMLSTTMTLQISELTSFSGIGQNTAITNFRVAQKETSRIRLEWDVPPSCYETTKFTIIYKTSDGRTSTVSVPANALTYTLDNLDPNTDYTIQGLDNDGSKTSAIKATTVPEDISFSTAAIAGISAMMLILIGIIIIVVILLRTGQLDETKQKVRKRISQYIIRPITTYNMKFNRRTGVYSGALDDDIYALGNMVLEAEEIWLVSFDDVILKEKIKSGHFADIYSAVFNNEAVVAKLLKKGYSEADSIVMKAKINYFANEKLEDENVLMFKGAVLNHPQFGVYILFEYCEQGALLGWLKSQRGKVNEDVLDKLYQIVFGASKGMAYLASKGVVHRRLGARNIYLDEKLEPKIAGLGPTPELKDGEDSSSGKERIPVKWTAIECIRNPDSATTLSDVWSFGILIWEIFSVGEEPYQGIRNKQVVSKILSGYRMKTPEFCSDPLGEIMNSCWKESPSERPTFTTISREIERLYSNYVDL